MRYQDINEKRRNPEQNPKQSVYEFLLPYKDDPNVYIHTTTVDKVGINPRSGSHDAPIGIYAFRLQDVWNDIEPWNTGKYADDPRELSFLPYYGGPNVYLLRSDIPADFLKDYSEQDLEKDVAKIQDIFNMSDEGIAFLKRAARTNLNFKKAPVGYLWGMTKSMAAGGVSEFDEYTPTNEKKWTVILRKLGYEAFNDPGYGWIHGAESTQALFLTGTSYKVIDKFSMKKKKTYDIDGKKYQAIPKRLHMKGIPNVFFHNNDPEEFTRVFEWTVEHMSINDLSTFTRFLPKRATGYIKQLGIGGSDYSGYSSDVVKYIKFMNDQRNVKVDTLAFGGQGDKVGAILSKVDDVKANKITINRFTEIPKYYMDQISPVIKAKLEQ